MFELIKMILSIIPVLAYLSVVYIFTRTDAEGNKIFGKDYNEMKVYSVVTLVIILFVMNIRLFI